MQINAQQRLRAPGDRSGIMSRASYSLPAISV
jgi:hypothetical protein